MEQLTYEQYRERYIPNWRYIPGNQWNDPNEGWYYNYLNSGHAEEDRKQKEESARKFAEEELKRKEQEEFDYQEGLAEFVNGHYDLEALKYEFRGDIRKAILFWYKNQKSKENVRDMMLNYAESL